MPGHVNPERDQFEALKALRRDAVKHRQAAVLDSRLIRLGETLTGADFSR